MAGKRILVVDDEDAIREVVEASLELLGDFEVLTASCGEEGVREAVAERPDAVLLDVMARHGRHRRVSEAPGG